MAESGARVMASPRPVLLFFGHHRCASSWADDIFRTVARELRLRHATCHATAVFGHALRAYVERHRLDCVAYTNADYREVEGLAPYRGFHVIRDPRDVAVSCYFSHRYSHRLDEQWLGLADRRAHLTRLSPDEGLLHEIEQLDGQFACMRSWRYDDPDVLELTMETLTADPYQHLLRIFRFLGLLDTERFSLARRAVSVLAKGLRTAEGITGDRITFPFGPRRIAAERLLGIAWDHEFEKIAGGRSPGNEDPLSHYRKGTPGDWRNHFRPAHVAAFKARYPGLVPALGYEPDDDWGVAEPDARAAHR